MLNKIIICASALLLALNLSAAVERHALVIGNANYAANPLRNPVNDARDMGARLTELGFQVELLLDADLPTMLSGVIEFGKSLDDNSVGLFYFAGHGMQAYNLQSDSDSNFLLPVNFAMSDEKQLPFDTLDVNRVVSAMSGSRSGGANIIILDACRDNPYERSFRTSSRGLTQMAGAEGLLIAYATAPGKVAADGDGRNGLFTEQLLLALDQPGQPVETVFKLVRQGVAGASGRAQVPFVSNGLIGDFYFNPAVAGKTPEPEQLITLTLRSNVYDDQVYINGAYAGQTKLVTQLAVGWHDIEVRKSGYQTYSARLFLDKDQTLVARLQRGADPTPQPAITQVVIAPPSSSTQSTSNTIDGFSLDDWLLFQQGKPATIASIEKIMTYERQHGGNAASRSYINRGLQVALANVNSADDLLEYQRKFGYLPGAPAQIEARLAELLAAGASRQDLIRLRGQFPASATLRLQLAGEYHRAQLFDAAAGEYQSWLGLTDSSHPERKQVLEVLVAAREGRSLQVSATAVPQAELIKLIGSTHSDYTKLDARGNKLLSSARSWSCVLDNRSGLIWEVKTDDDGARDKDNEYRWGGEGVSDMALANYDGNDESQRKQSRWNGKGTRYDDWNKLITAANSEQLCGFSDWRVPDLYQLASLVRCRGGSYKNLDDGCSGSYQRPTIDTKYFPNTQSSRYWSASPDADGSSYAWVVGFSNGYDGDGSRDYSRGYVRLVRSRP